MGTDKRVAVVEACGDIDLHRSGDFQRGLLEPLAEGPRAMVVDLAAVPYMDSAGVASLVKLLARVRKQGIALRLSGLSVRVRSVFEITRLNTVFEVYATVQQAVEA
jgi:anti-sigma B factor antagonist